MIMMLCVFLCRAQWISCCGCLVSVVLWLPSALCFCRLHILLRPTGVLQCLSDAMLLVVLLSLRRLSLGLNSPELHICSVYSVLWWYKNWSWKYATHLSYHHHHHHLHHHYHHTFTSTITITTMLSPPSLSPPSPSPPSLSPPPYHQHHTITTTPSPPPLSPPHHHQVSTTFFYFSAETWSEGISSWSQLIHTCMWH